MTTIPAFATSEGLRELLRQLHSGERDWRDAPEAAELMDFTMKKYGALARKNGLEPADAAVAAFEVMRARASRNALDPWAVVTRAVQLTLTYEARANGLLCSTGRARRAESARFHDAERFSDRDTPVYEHHPAFRVEPQTAHIDGQDDPPAEREESTNAFVALDRTVEVFIELGWPPEVARAGVEYIGNRLMHSGTRRTAFEYLRRDRHAQALLDLDQWAWLLMLRAVLGNQSRDRTETCSGRGLLLLLLIGFDVDDVLGLPSVTSPIRRAARTLRLGHSLA